jgi:4-amino-4-deoxy-L-arabinose transferase-like glycosyltransferase
MSDTKILSNLSIEELVAKQKSLTNWQKIFISIAVVLVGMTLFAVYKKSNDMHPFLILVSLFLILDNGTKLKKVEAEINKRKD